MLRKVNKYFLVIVALGLVGLISFFAQVGIHSAVADSGLGSGFYGDVSYTCMACPDLPTDCWQQGDRVAVFTYPDQYSTGRSRPITKTGARSGYYSNLVPPDIGYWYLRGLGTTCRSSYYLVYWTGELMQTVEQDINMSINTPIEGPGQ